MELKALIPLKLKIEIKYLLSTETNELDLNNQKNIFLFMAADYGNLGDCAITYAQKSMLKKIFTRHTIIEIPISKTYKLMKELKKKVNNDDLITIIGGGNNGDLYIDCEWCRQFIIKQFPNNKIISFPQTADFSDTKKGKKILKNSLKVYSKHKNLILCAREEYSYEFYKKYFVKNKAILVPDIVLSLDEREPSYERNGLIICMRDDKEKFISDEDKHKLIDNLAAAYKINYYDTHIGAVVLNEKERKEELEKIWTAFKKAECVITDRLHGMIFCAITGTPCVILPNNNNKIKGVYQWIKDIQSIKMVDNVDQVRNAVESVKRVVTEIPNMKKRFEPLRRILIDTVNK